jgi:hypothetical protein
MHHTMKREEAVEIQFHANLILTLDGGGQLHPLGNELQYPLDRRLSGHQSLSGHDSEENSLYPCQ